MLISLFFAVYTVLVILSIFMIIGVIFHDLVYYLTQYIHVIKSDIKFTIY